MYECDRPEEHVRLSDPLRSPMQRAALRYTEKRTDTEDVVQEVALRMWTMGGRLREVRRMETLAITVVEGPSEDIRLAGDVCR